MAYQVELTDTFGGEANYCWVRRARIAAPEWTQFKEWDGNGRREPRAYQRTVMRRAKAAVGMTGARGVTVSYGGGYEFRPYGQCVIMFVNWDDGDGQ